ncbi:MAG: hypothetical protein R3F12_06560 [Lysobacteraceae bacterium]
MTTAIQTWEPGNPHQALSSGQGFHFDRQQNRNQSAISLCVVDRQVSGRRKRARDAAPSSPANDSLSLSILSRRIDELAAAYEDVPASVGENGAFYTILTGMALLFLGSFLPPNLFKVVVMAAGLLLQVIGFLFWPVLWYRRNRQDFDLSHRRLAAEFDRHYVALHQLVRWLRRFPVSQREALLRYVGYRQKHLGYRGAKSGKMERTGF